MRRGKDPPLKAAEGGPAQETDRVFPGVMQAIAMQRLPPGTKLSEEALGEVFGVSRTQVRAALLRLNARGLVTMHSKRTARIASPSVKEARELFALRRLVEPAVAAQAAGEATSAALRVLKRCLREEHVARDAGDRIAATRLAGEFHLRLAEISGNEMFLEIVGLLIDRMSLVTLLYQAPGSLPCVNEEHNAIMVALEGGDGPAAETAMLAHLRSLERRMLLHDRPAVPTDLKAAFAGMI